MHISNLLYINNVESQTLIPLSISHPHVSFYINNCNLFIKNIQGDHIELATFENAVYIYLNFMGTKEQMLENNKFFFFFGFNPKFSICPRLQRKLWMLTNQSHGFTTTVGPTVDLEFHQLLETSTFFLTEMFGCPRLQSAPSNTIPRPEHHKR